MAALLQGKDCNVIEATEKETGTVTYTSYYTNSIEYIDIDTVSPWIGGHRVRVYVYTAPGHVHTKLYVLM